MEQPCIYNYAREGNYVYCGDVLNWKGQLQLCILKFLVVSVTIKDCRHMCSPNIKEHFKLNFLKHKTSTFLHQHHYTTLKTRSKSEKTDKLYAYMTTFSLKWYELRFYYKSPARSYEGRGENGRITIYCYRFHTTMQLALMLYQQFAAIF